MKKDSTQHIIAVDKYEVHEKVGSGAFANVHLCKDKGSGEEWAMKIIDKKNLDQKWVKQIRDEVAIMQAIDHPNVIKCQDFLEDPSYYFIVMQLCNKGDLMKHMEESKIKNFTEDQALYFLFQIGLGFYELHKYQIMHRDFKLANLLMHDNFLLIGDFGLVKKGQEMCKTQVGTPEYNAPEILEGKVYTYIVDLWAVGVSFFYLLFGK